MGKKTTTTTVKSVGDVIGDMPSMFGTMGKGIYRIFNPTTTTTSIKTKKKFDINSIDDFNSSTKGNRNPPTRKK